MKLAFVPPRFGPGVLGGSEAVSREAALGFAQRGHDVEVLTTCALDHYTWANELPEGVLEQDGLTVRRFSVVRHPSRAALRAQLSIQAGAVPDMDHQVSWLGFQFASPGMFEYLLRSGRRYDAVIFSPYLFWNASVCAPLVAERAVVIPCLHDEAYARLEVLRPVIGDPALVWFLSAPEHQLAHGLGPVARRHSVTGAGVPVPSGYDPFGFAERHNLRRPFVLFAGRNEEGKGHAWLLEAFAAAVTDRGLDLDLVTIGKGEPGAHRAVPKSVADRVIDLGFVSDEERDNAFAAASAYVQPSRVESFSRTIMESWLAGTPVIASAKSNVVAWHCWRSGGGLMYSTAAEFAEHLDLVARKPELADEVAAAGRRYVIENYTWPNVLDRMEASLAAAL
jgi:glycosyltransferase involved in cell wall biosynthesis